jgi:hypothetical protein
LLGNKLSSYKNYNKGLGFRKYGRRHRRKGGLKRFGRRRGLFGIFGKKDVV